MRILIVTAQVPFVQGGAEILAAELRAALVRHGHDTDVVSLPFKWYPADVIPDQMLACRLFDLSSFNGTRVDRVICLKFPAYLVRHDIKVLWLLHQHREAYELWDQGQGALFHDSNGREIRELIRQADSRAIGGEFSGRFTISKRVSERLQQNLGLDSEPVYHPPRNSNQFRVGRSDEYFFFPSRVSPIKRQKLALEALSQSRGAFKMVFAGVPDSPQYMTELENIIKRYRLQRRIQFLGQVSEEEKIRLYANCRAVCFPPVDEDYGYVTLEAMLSGKPIVTCGDSGGVLEFVKPQETGFVCEPDADSMSEALSFLANNEKAAIKLGNEALRFYQRLNIGWDEIVGRLTQ